MVDFQNHLHSEKHVSVHLMNLEHSCWVIGDFLKWWFCLSAWQKTPKCTFNHKWKRLKKRCREQNCSNCGTLWQAGRQAKPSTESDSLALSSLNRGVTLSSGLCQFVPTPTFREWKKMNSNTQKIISIFV